MYEKAKEYLRQVQSLKEKIDALEELIEELSDNLGVKGISFEYDGSAKGSTDVHKREKRMAELQDKKDTLEAEKHSLLLKKVDILSTINSLDNPIYIKLLKMRYIQCLHWEEVACTIHHSYHYTHELHSKALSEIDNKLKERTKSYKDIC